MALEFWELVLKCASTIFVEWLDIRKNDRRRSVTGSRLSK